MSRFKLRGHQTYALEVMGANRELGIFYAIGCGKTMIVLSWLKDALRRGVIKDMLVICPASLVSSWHHAIDELYKFEGFDTHTVEQIRNAITVTSFQKTWHTERKRVNHKNGAISMKKVTSLRPEVDKVWGAVVVDESHSIGSHSSNQTKAAITLGKLARFRYILSGTPVHGGGGSEDFSKLYGQLQFLSRGSVFKNWKEFCAEYVTRVDKWGKPRKYDTVKCRRLMQEWGITCRLEDCEDMPGKTEQEYPCKLAEARMYQDVMDGDGEKYGLDLEVAGSQHSKMLQICSGSCKISDTNTLMLKCTKDDVLGEILNGTSDPVVIFCKYRASVDRCADIVRRVERNPLVLDGRSKGDEWKRFADGRADTLICQYMVGSAGLNLQNSSLMVFYEPDFSALAMEQAAGRIYRKGQERKCVFYYLYTKGTIEENVMRTVRSGKDVSNEMLIRWSKGEVF